MRNHATDLVHHYSVVGALGCTGLGVEMLGGNTAHYLGGLLVGLCIGKGFWNHPVR
jgi:hypothetical protein